VDPAGADAATAKRTASRYRSASSNGTAGSVDLAGAANSQGSARTDRTAGARPAADIQCATSARATNARAARPGKRHIGAAVSGQIAVRHRGCCVDEPTKRDKIYRTSIGAGRLHGPRRIGGSVVAKASRHHTDFLTADAISGTVRLGFADKVLDIDRRLASTAHGQRNDQAPSHSGNE
jgi:hypothetical protein